MSRFTLFFLVIYSLGVSSKAFAQQNTLLYSIKHEDSKFTSYLYGTMHVMSEENFFFPSEIENILSNCDALCLEIENISDQKPRCFILSNCDRQVFFQKGNGGARHLFCKF